MRIPRLLPFAALTLLAGCAVQHTLLSGRAVRNRTGRELTEITVTHQPGGRTIYANDILPGREMALSFHEMEMQATSVNIRWTDPVLGPREKDLALDNLAHDRGVKHIVYEIGPDGEVTVHFEPAR